MFFKKSSAYTGNKGFTVLEMIVVLSIVGLISGVILFNYRLFNQRLSLSSAAQEVAIAIRQAQTYGLSVKQTSQGSGEFDKAYGIAFDTQLNTKAYYLYVDKDGDGFYDGDDTCNPLSECIKKELILNAAWISGFCGIDASGASTQTCPVNSVRQMSVTFRRPNRDAFIYFFDNNSNSNRTGPYNMGQVKFITSASGPESSVKVELSGQISTQ